MLKPLTLSLSLALALGLCTVSKAGLYDGGCTTCGLASPQGVMPSAQGHYVGCEQPCKPKHHFNFSLKNCLPHHEVCYEWVLKKKHVWHHSKPSCDTCGPAPIHPTGQHIAPSGQYAAPSGQYAAPAAAPYGAPQVYGAGQRAAFLPARTTTNIASVPAEMTPAAPGGEEVPPAPEVKGTSSNLLLPSGSGN